MLLGKQYSSEHKNSEFTTFIGEVLEQELAEALNKSQNFSSFVDGLNDATEWEIIYILYLTETGAKELHSKLVGICSNGARVN